LSSSGRPIPNRHVWTMLAAAQVWCDRNDMILEGELFSPSLALGEHVSVFCSGRGNGTPKPIPVDAALHVFDSLSAAEWEASDSPAFADRYARMEAGLADVPNVRVIEQRTVECWGEVEARAAVLWANGGEGLILRDWQGRYKHGRCSFGDQDMFKIKKFRMFDAVVVEVVQQTGIAVDAERETDEFGRSKPVGKRDGRELRECAGALVCEMVESGQIIKVGSGLDMQGGDRDRGALWERRAELPGRHLEFKASPIGVKDLPLYPTFERWRQDLD